MPTKTSNLPDAQPSAVAAAASATTTGQNPNGAPVGPKPETPEELGLPRVTPDGTTVGTPEGPDDPYAPKPNELAQPHWQRKMSQVQGTDLDSALRPKQYTGKMLELLGRTVLFNHHARTRKGEPYIAQRPAIIVDVLDAEGTRVNLNVFWDTTQDGANVSAGTLEDVQYAQDPNTAKDKTWSHVTRF